MIRLKDYQRQALEALSTFLERCRILGPSGAYEAGMRESLGEDVPFRPYRALEGLEDAPYACMRLPTGGGKTLLSACTIPLAAGRYLDDERPLVLWMAPSDAIKTQTLEALRDPGSAVHERLSEEIGGGFSVFPVDDFENIRPSHLSDGACIVLSTFAAFRVRDTGIRKVYEDNENLFPHFKDGGDDEEPPEGIGRHSFVALLRRRRPLVILDEAHNAKSELSVEMLKHLNPSCVIEYTATPAGNSNIIHSSSAAELKAEEMIKLPVVLSVHDAWREAVSGAIQRRNHLDEAARESGEDIRPVLLFQAESKGEGERLTVEFLLEHLTEEENIPRGKIAVHTGKSTQRELAGVDFFDPDCPIRHVITVQALKEGWDCPFAYVLCTLASSKSHTAAEQLLGRVLRMPFAKRRKSEDLNQAYAYTSSHQWSQTVEDVRKRLVDMGFEKQEASEFVCAVSPEGLDMGPSFEILLRSKPDLSGIDLLERTRVKVESESPTSHHVEIKASDVMTILPKLLRGTKDEADKKHLQREWDLYESRTKRRLSPSQRGEVFDVPRLCLEWEGKIYPADDDFFLDAAGWNLADHDAELPWLRFDVAQRTIVLDTGSEGRMKVRMQGMTQSQLHGLKTELTEKDLCMWLDRRLRQPDVSQDSMLEFVRRGVQHLLGRDGIDMETLDAGKFMVERALRLRIGEHREAARARGYQELLFKTGAGGARTLAEHVLRFDPENYPATLLYNGPLEFLKHYYQRVGIMNGEESICASAIDMNDKVAFWVRNLERKGEHCFHLPLAGKKFYPDFVAKLTSGRILVVEYKGKHLTKGDDTKSKALIGAAWAEASGNRFLMAVEKDEQGRDAAAQIEEALRGD